MSTGETFPLQILMSVLWVSTTAMRVPPALMWWEVRTVSPVPATLDTLEMESPVWVSIAVFLLTTTPLLANKYICTSINSILH